MAERASARPGSPTTDGSASFLAHVGGFEAVEDDVEYFVPGDAIRGTVPESIRGSFLRVVPGRNRLGGEPFGHWFDGDGCVHSATFTEEGVRYRHKFVGTRKYVEETETQRVSRRSVGHNAPGGVLRNIGRMPENCANTNIVHHAEKLLALWEGGLPYEVDPVTLDTVGPYRFGGELGRFARFSAHPSVDPQTGELFNCGVGFGLRGPQLDLFRVSAGGSLVDRGRIPLEHSSFLHDFGMSEKYLVFMISPLVLEDPVRAILGLRTFDECLNFRPEVGMRCVVVSKDDFRVVTEFDVDPFLVFHFSNCWEEGDEIVVDLVHLGQPDTQDAFANHIFDQPARAEDWGPLWRYRINTNTGLVTDHSLPGTLSGEFPQWDHRRSGQSTRFIYSSGYVENGTAGFFNAVQRVDLETCDTQVHEFGKGRFTSEVAFVPSTPDGREEDGHLLAMVYDANSHRSEIVILDAREIDNEVAVVPLENHVPHGFHGTYTAVPLNP